VVVDTLAGAITEPGMGSKMLWTIDRYKGNSPVQVMK
jgi:hypothetical protein